MADAESNAPFTVPPGPARLFLTTAPPSEAHRIARTLVDERLAACVSLLPGVRSIFRWQDAVHDEPETLLLVKTTSEALEPLGARLRTLHPYDLPEALVVAPEGAGAAYLDWLLAQTGPPAAP